MELTEPIESINKQLVDLFGIDSVTGRPIWRVVWSEEQFEKRLMNVTNEGFHLLIPEVREVPKYRQWIKERYVLERLTVIPEVNENELPTEKLSYEPIWVFETQRGVYLPPRLDAAKIVIDTVYAAMGKSSLAKYKETNEAPEEKDIRLGKLQDELFGNETEVGDALAHNQAIIVPSNYKVN